MEWDQPARARDQARAALAELGVLGCPVLDLAPWERLLALSPAERLLEDTFPNRPLEGGIAESGL